MSLRVRFVHWNRLQASRLGCNVNELSSHGDMLSQDEREVKRQRRKQSNRESARRSRLRKQAECETLSQKVDALVDENARLRTLNRHLQEQLDKFISGFGKVIHLHAVA